jgi:hypothetical protein
VCMCLLFCLCLCYCKVEHSILSVMFGVGDQCCLVNVGNIGFRLGESLGLLLIHYITSHITKFHGFNLPVTSLHFYVKSVSRHFQGFATC